MCQGRCVKGYVNLDKVNIFHCLDELLLAICLRKTKNTHKKYLNYLNLHWQGIYHEPGNKQMESLGKHKSRSVFSLKISMLNQKWKTKMAFFLMVSI